LKNFNIIFIIYENPPEEAKRSHLKKAKFKKKNTGNCIVIQDQRLFLFHPYSTIQIKIVNNFNARCFEKLHVRWPSVYTCNEPLIVLDTHV
jgi:hypothetical protein